MSEPKLFMVLLGCTPAGRHTEQHDIFFGIAERLSDLKPGMLSFWPEAEGRLHIDSWREVGMVDGYQVQIFPRPEGKAEQKERRLFFLNLGGYKPGDFEEYHYKMITACGNISEAIQSARSTAFYKHTGFQQAESHIDDKYGVDVDDVYQVEDILPPADRDRYVIHLVADSLAAPDELHIGYFKLSKI